MEFKRRNSSVSKGLSWVAQSFDRQARSHIHFFLLPMFLLIGHLSLIIHTPKYAYAQKGK